MSAFGCEAITDINVGDLLSVFYPAKILLVFDSSRHRSLTTYLMTDSHGEIFTIRDDQIDTYVNHIVSKVVK